VPIVYREQPWRHGRLTPDGPRRHGARVAPANFISRRVGDGGGSLNRRRRHRRYTSLAH